MKSSRQGSDPSRRREVSDNDLDDNQVTSVKLTSPCLSLSSVWRREVRNKRYKMTPSKFTVHTTVFDSISCPYNQPPKKTNVELWGVVQGFPLPGVPDWASCIAFRKVGTISRTLVTVAVYLQTERNREIWSISCRAPLPFNIVAAAPPIQKNERIIKIVLKNKRRLNFPS